MSFSLRLRSIRFRYIFCEVKKERKIQNINLIHNALFYTIYVVLSVEVMVPKEIKGSLE